MKPLIALFLAYQAARSGLAAFHAFDGGDYLHVAGWLVLTLFLVLWARAMVPATKAERTPKQNATPAD